MIFSNIHPCRPRAAVGKILLVMKLITVLLTTVILQVSASSFGQSISLSVKNAPLKQVFNTIKQQTGYYLIYGDEMISGSRKVNVNLKNVSLQEALNKVLENQGLGYDIEDRTIIIKKKVPSFLDRVLDVFADIDVRGIVLDSAGVPLSGATVSLKGTDRSVRTNERGEFFLQGVRENAVILISYLGYETREMQVGANLGAIRLKGSSSRLAEVLVSTGYQRIPRDRAAGSFGFMKEAELDKRANVNILTYLEGQVPGLLTDANGRITIRGQSTIATSSNRDPLIVLDGFPIERPVESINANDVESITVLKDASAASIWGVRAANGVIVIQTKRGKSSRKSLDIDFSATATRTALPQLSKLPFASSASYIELEKFKVDNNLSFFTGVPRPAISPAMDAYLNNPSAAAAIVEPLKNVNSYDEFEDLFMSPANRQQYALAIAGKGERSTHRASFSYDHVNSSFKGNGNQRFVTDLYETLTITARLRADIGLNYVMNNEKLNGMDYTDLKSLLPYQQIVGENGSYIPQTQTFYQKDKENYVASGYPYNWDYNLKREFDNKHNSIRTNSINVVAGLSYQILKGLSANLGFQYESGNAAARYLFNEETYLVRNAVNFSTAKVNNVLVSGVPKGGIYAEYNNSNYSQTYRGQLKYDTELGNGKHAITAIGGMEVRELGSKGSAQTKYGYNEQSLQYARVNYNSLYTDVRGSQNLLSDQIALPNGLGRYPVLQDELNRFVSAYGNAGYTFMGKYSANASARLDKTNLFGSSDQYRNVWLWSAGLSWQLHKESLLENSIFNSLILRATYGINGNVNKTTSPYLIANAATNPATNQPYAYVANPTNPLLRWEKTTVTNVGIDFAVLNNRLRGSLEYYNRSSSDLLGNATVNGTYGFNSAFINYANMKNRGVDVNLSGLVIDGTFKWNATINYSYNRNRVTNVDFPQKTVGAYTSSIPQAGLPLSYVYSYKWAGLSGTGMPQVLDENGTAVGYKTEMANTAALIYQGTDVSPHYGAFINEFSYKNLSVVSNFTFKFGHRFRVPVIQYATGYSGALQVHEDWDNRWKTAGDEMKTNTPVAPTTVTGLNIYDQYTKYADINVQTASVIRFRELLVNYRLPSGLFGANPESVFTVGLQIRNLAAYKFNKAGLDPEYLTVDNNNIILPPRPEFALMLKANF